MIFFGGGGGGVKVVLFKRETIVSDFLFKLLDHENFLHTVEPRFRDTRLIRTPRYYGQFRWSRQKPRTFSLKLTRLIWTPVNTDNGHFSVSRVTKSYTLSTPLYGHYLSVHCEFSLSRLFANLKTLDPGEIMTEFEELKPFYYKEKLNSVTSGV